MLLKEIIQGAPELIIILGGLIGLMVGVFQRTSNGQPIALLAIVTLSVALAATFWTGIGDEVGFFGLLVFNAFTQFVKQLILLATVAVLVMGYRQLEREDLNQFEYPILALLATSGMMVMVSANDLISFFIGLELQSLSLYIMVAFRRESSAATEAALKYFVLGTLATVFILYGSSLIYGYLGSTQFSTIMAVLKSQNAWPIGVKVGILMVLLGTSFKISLVPFHMWTPDVYQGSPTPVTIFVGTASKIAGVAIFIRFALEVFHPTFELFNPVLTALSLFSMVVGTFAALFQKNIKRLLGYSATSHMGYILLGLLGGQFEGVRSALIYVTIYMAMTITAFACLLCLRRHDKLLEEIDELTGLANDRPLIATIFTVVLFSYAGIPPLAGFFAKFAVFSTAIQSGFYGLAIIGVLTSVVGAAYYLKIVKVMFFDKIASVEGSLKIDRGIPRETILVMVTGMVIIVGYIFQSDLVNEITYKATKALFYRV
jgi:NADH-quinone oxidoreductase subunit N